MPPKRVSQVKPEDPPEPLEVRVLKRWIPYFKNKEKMLDLCYLLVDLHGDAIEAVADVTKAEYFDSLIKVQHCYTVDKYVSSPSHYIGRIEEVSPIMYRSGKKLRKIVIQDERRNEIEVTLWDEKADMIQTEDIIGKVFAITATTVTYFNKLQLESTTSTTIDINPPIPDLQTYVNRFQELMPLAEQRASLNHITIADLKKKIYNKTAQGHYTCTATITEIDNLRTWFYVKCPKCGKRAYPEKDRFVCLDDDIEEEPIFMYCLNAKITDNTDSTEVVFYNEALNGIVKVSCRDMVINLGNRNPKVFRDKITSAKGIPKLLHIAVRNDNSIAVNKAENPRTIQPATPDPKKTATKRPLPQLSESDRKAKHQA
ncbi:putative replication protein A, OB [Helianthus annuus]|uniref:Replication protein A, OB n=1 Tax=Helianthus annuus TaxID=4232 RepID=A0A9K3NTL3_HELAN|nr:putative replication protein A, OB [Helianthus annuus]KAJ0591073.1 putative replication protein A, OB [Helianthus annuus]KAJ0598734.1 putative replication protein A, OB [Helianthus annuus]KAJ0762990.1 putative replication protein A, OB [Helianthus annuus]KAJ0928934.1 putative replication protein A, OB [Helianthus annuus]